MRKTERYDPTESGSLLFLYSSIYGRMFLKLLTRPFISKIVGKYMDSRFSVGKISSFLKKNDIDMKEYEDKQYSSFNDFFTRKIRPEYRPFDMSDAAFVSPCDAFVSVYPITPDSTYVIKETPYSVESLLRDKELAEKFVGGSALVFRLCVHHYHRYYYFDSGRQEPSVKIPGVLHTVQPIALERHDYFKENSRSYNLLHTSHFGDAVMCEVGALMVGRITNADDGEFLFEKGREKGYFEFGGSTVVVLVEKDRVTFDDELVRNTQNGLETEVKCGEKIGEAIRNVDFA